MEEKFEFDMVFREVGVLASSHHPQSDVDIPHLLISKVVVLLPFMTGYPCALNALR